MFLWNLSADYLSTKKMNVQLINYFTYLKKQAEKMIKEVGKESFKNVFSELKVIDEKCSLLCFFSENKYINLSSIEIIRLVERMDPLTMSEQIDKEIDREKQALISQPTQVRWKFLWEQSVDEMSSKDDVGLLKKYFEVLKYEAVASLLQVNATNFEETVQLLMAIDMRILELNIWLEEVDKWSYEKEKWCIQTIEQEYPIFHKDLFIFRKDTWYEKHKLNQKLSRRRIEAVEELLQGNGV